MNRAVVLNSIDDAKVCIGENLHRESRLFSTHASVDIYLREFHGLDCQCLSTHLSTEDILVQRKIASQIVDEVVHELDGTISKNINEKWDLKVRWFETLYSYLGKHHLQGYLCFVEAIKRVIDIYQLKKINFFNIRFNQFLETPSELGQIIKFITPQVHFEIIHGQNISRTSPHAIGNDLKRYLNLLRHSPKHVSKKLWDYLLNYFHQESFAYGRPTLLCLFSYNLRFLKKALHGRYNLLNLGEFLKSISLSYSKDLEDQLDLQDDFAQVENNIARENDTFKKLMLQDIRNDFRSNVAYYVKVLDELKKRHQRYTFGLCIIGGPQVGGVGAMCCEYLRSEDVHIVIGQHGCLYGEIDEPWHFDSDFNRCNTFISYGFTKTDLSQLYPGKEIKTEIVPSGYLPLTACGPKKIDILFPATNSLSFFNGGVSRIKPDKLAERQIKLLEFLDSFANLDIYVKLFVNSSYDNCAILPVLKRLKNVKVVDHVDLLDFLKMYHPRVVLIEYPSQPLVEVLRLDTEIFLMPDDILPYGEAILNDLKKRVNLCETIEDAKIGICAYFQGQLKPKRDETYQKHFIDGERPEEVILNLIDHLVNRKKML